MLCWQWYIENHAKNMHFLCIFRAILTSECKQCRTHSTQYLVAFPICFLSAPTQYRIFCNALQYLQRYLLFLSELGRRRGACFDVWVEEFRGGLFGQEKSYGLYYFRTFPRQRVYATSKKNRAEHRSDRNVRRTKTYF